MSILTKLTYIMGAPQQCLTSVTMGPAMTASIELIALLLIIPIGFVLYNIWRTRQAGQQPQFNDQEIALREAFFADLSHTDFEKLLHWATWREIDAGQTLLTKGEKVAKLSLIFSGVAKVNVGNDNYVEIKAGQFIGEMSYISGNLASGTVVIAEKALLVEWPQEQLKTLVSQDTVIGNCIQSHFNRDLRHKLG